MRTLETIAKRRLEMVQAVKEDVGWDLGDVVFTCDTCPERNTCPSDFDPYNQDGDCLENK